MMETANRILLLRMLRAFVVHSLLLRPGACRERGCCQAARTSRPAYSRPEPPARKDIEWFLRKRCAPPENRVLRFFSVAAWPPAGTPPATPRRGHDPGT